MSGNFCMRRTFSFMLKQRYYKYGDIQAPLASGQFATLRENYVYAHEHVPIPGKLKILRVINFCVF